MLERQSVCRTHISTCAPLCFSLSRPPTAITYSCVDACCASSTALHLAPPTAPRAPTFYPHLALLYSPSPRPSAKLPRPSMALQASPGGGLAQSLGASAMVLGFLASIPFYSKFTGHPSPELDLTHGGNPEPTPELLPSSHTMNVEPMPPGFYALERSEDVCYVDGPGDTTISSPRTTDHATIFGGYAPAQALPVTSSAIRLSALALLLSAIPTLLALLPTSKLTGLVQATIIHITVIVLTIYLCTLFSRLMRELARQKVVVWQAQTKVSRLHAAMHLQEQKRITERIELLQMLHDLVTSSENDHSNTKASLARLETALETVQAEQFQVRPDLAHLQKGLSTALSRVGTLFADQGTRATMAKFAVAKMKRYQTLNLEVNTSFAKSIAGLADTDVNGHLLAFMDAVASEFSKGTRRPPPVFNTPPGGFQFQGAQQYGGFSGPRAATPAGAAYGSAGRANAHAGFGTQGMGYGAGR
ncbi:hypothetical protein BDV95DRAFT_639122 [Massariosphaeria phaeospora]|uniref:Uncharacterized protein n=1 Tax=Massariosphaeria phaeospora TaxID=100035 RepID=A0A7C8MI69_9PLEO|nr:hypothetical protein BDV95DRAFT_639122 [Massariosphaeria phaeospora]